MEEKLPKELETLEEEPNHENENIIKHEERLENAEIPVPNENFSQRPGIHIIDENELQFDQASRDMFEKEIKKLKAKRRFSGAFIAAVVFFLLALAVPVIVSTYYPYKYEVTTTDYLLILLTSYLFIHVFTILISKKTLGIKLFEPFTNRPKKPKKAFLTVLVAIGIGFLVQVAVQPIYYIIPTSSETGMFATPQTTLLFFIVVAIIPSIFEEWLIRGFILRHLLPLGKWTAIIVSAGIFGLLHSHPAQAIFAFALGIMLGIVYLNSGGNIWLTFIIHFLNNSFSVVQGYVYENYGMESIWMDYITITQYSLMAIALLVLLYYTFKGKKIYFLPDGIEEPDNSYDGKPKDSAKLIFRNISTYVFIALSLYMMLVSYIQTMATTG